MKDDKNVVKIVSTWGNGESQTIQQSTLMPTSIDEPNIAISPIDD
jgi:hypothetical protein